MSRKPRQKYDPALRTLNKIANMRTVVGHKEKSRSVMIDRNGHGISAAELARDVDAGFRHFWSKRGGVPNVVAFTSGLGRIKREGGES